jgi:bis(5'-nucleosyl)-tetraphosphatase (symmetrical)
MSEIGLNDSTYFLDLSSKDIPAPLLRQFCWPDGRLDMQCKLPPAKAADTGLIPWFKVARQQPLGHAIVFGHWAALGGTIQPGLYGLDTGCVWGGELTLLRWEDKVCFTQPALNGGA